MPFRARANKRMYGIPVPEKQEQKYKRVRSAAEYHSTRWTKASRIFREMHPLCTKCEAEGIINASEVVDHIVPYPVCADFWDEKNWQPLCKKHNAEKGNKDKKIIAEFRGKK